MTAGDAKSERVISVDAEPDGIGIVKHDSYLCWGVKLDMNKSRLTGTRPIFGSISSTGFETSGTALAVEVVPELTKVHTGEFPVVYRCYQANQGAERLIDPLNPKFRGDAFAANMLIQENRWRAQRYGIDEGLVDFGKGVLGDYAGLLEEIIELTREDAEELDCVEEILHARTILDRGTSAHRQLAVYDSALAAGGDKDAAFKAVVDFLIEETVAGLD